MKTRGIIVGIVLVLLAASATPAQAHATLLRSTPAANAALERAPAQVELFFSEGLEPSFSTIQVLDATGAPVDGRDARVDPADNTHLTVSLRSLPAGVYTVTWRALSATDGHATTGAFPFAVGNVEAGALAAAAPATQPTTLSLGEIVAKWLLYLTAALLTGGALFRLIVWQPALRAEAFDPAESPAEARLNSIALSGLLAASALGLWVQAGQASGVEIAAPWSRAVGEVLFTTRYGALWLGRLASALTLAGLLIAAPRDRARWAALGMAALLLLTVSLGSHASAEAQPLWPIAADWVHLLAASVWVGGLIAFAVGLWSRRGDAPARRTRLAARLIPRFSALALISVAVLALTGLYSALLRVGTWTALTQTFYGQVLLVKLAIVAALIGLGAVNLLIISPRMRRGAAVEQGQVTLVERFRGVVASEITLGAALLLSVGVLTSAPPAQLTATRPALTASADVDDLHLNIEITPGRVGLNTFTVTVAANGQPVNDAHEVGLLFTPSQASVPPSRAQLTGQGNGAYAIKGAFFSLPSAWQVQAVVRREGQFDSYANFNFDVGRAASAPLPWGQVAGILTLLAALAYAFALSRLTATRLQFLAVGALPAAALALAGLFVFYQPAPATASGPANPVPPNPASLAQGQTLFTTNCVPCHGASGKGDGPVGVTLNPRPADLSLHAVPGVHTDGELFLWITNGYPGSVMPAFGKTLADTDRWNLVNYVRTLAPK